MKKWKSTIAVGLAFLLICSIPAMAQVKDTETNVPNGIQSEKTVTNDGNTDESINNESNTDEALPIETDAEVNTVSLEENAIEVVECEIAFDASENLQSLGPISTKTAIVINGEENQLYCTFDDSSEAIENLNSQIPSLLSVLKEKYELDELSDANWEDYKNIMGDFESDIDYQSTEYKDFSILSSFFDIYENESKNDNIIQLASVGNERMINNEQVEELMLSLPSRSPASKKYRSTMKQGVEPRYIDRNDAVNYAEEYAEWYNTDYAFFGTGDCANFVSQILSNSGIQQTDRWWHELSGGMHTHSNQWTVADDFCGYFGVDFETPDFTLFANKAVQTDIIAYDETDDWDWDHVAFVTDTGGTVPYDNYKSIRIAQHTSNYIKWVEDTGWPELKDNNPDLIFGIIYGRLIR